MAETVGSRMALKYLSPEQRALLEDYCERVGERGRVLIKDASLKLEEQRAWVQDKGHKGLDDAREKLEAQRCLMENLGRKGIEDARMRLEDHRARARDKANNICQSLRLWCENLRAWLSLQWRIVSSTARQKTEPVRRWLILQKNICLEFVRLLQLPDSHGRTGNLLNNWKGELYRIALFLNIFLLLFRVSTWQVGYMRHYADAVSSQTQTQTRDLPYRVRRRSATLSRMSPLDEKAQNGCLSWKGPPAPVIVNAAPSPTGLVVTMLLGEISRDNVCAFFPGQLENFLLPQGLDVLFLMPPHATNQDSGRSMREELLQCLKLSDQPVKSKKKWKNLDGTTMTTLEYALDVTTLDPSAELQGSRGGISIFFGETEIELPHYVREDPSILQKPLSNQCDAPFNFIQGTRWYTNEMLHLSILKEYEYFVKLDTDVAFVKPLPIHLLHDMKLRGAVFGHTASFAHFGLLPCGDEITAGIEAFERRWIEYKQGNRLAAEDLFPSKSLSRSKSTWGGLTCSNDNARMHMDTDYYYSNFVLGRTDYFQRPEVLALGRFLSEYPNGFFKYRWTDQTFWHFALGLFVKDFEGGGVVADYTDFRCAPLKNCWWSFYNREQSKEETREEQCRNGGAFLHSKSLKVFIKEWPQVNVTSALMKAERQTIPYESKYRHECPDGIL